MINIIRSCQPQLIECYCQTENGQPENNGILCKVENTFQPSGSCESHEWCTGPTNPKISTEMRKLCSMGKKKRG